MNRLRSDQRQKVSQFVLCTQTTEDKAIRLLSHFEWNINLAVDAFFQHPHGSNSNGDTYRIEQLFTIYANDPRDDPTPGGQRRIGPNGVAHLLNDLQLEPTDRRVLILAAKLKAQTQCEFSWEEWKEGCTSMRVSTIDQLRDRLLQIDESMDLDNAKFREVYAFTFLYGKEPRYRNMEMDLAVAYWKILFKDKFSLMPLWEEFLAKEHGKAISRDTWNLLLDFVFNIKPDLSNYDLDGAWPVLIDQFVDYARTKLGLSAPEN